MFSSVYRILLLLLVLAISCGDNNPETEDHYFTPQNPFENYLNLADDAYGYEKIQVIEGDGYSVHLIRMISQRWLEPGLVDETEWWHWLTIVIPDELDTSKGLLWIGGGSRYDDPPQNINLMLIRAALETNSITADLHNIPFQPLSFSGDHMEERYEDELIAFGWRQFLEGGAKDDDATWLARLPMTKAVQRAMDTISEYSSQNTNIQVEEFAVAGASKRGWTAWTTAIFDDRVIGIIPVVIDLLNMKPSFEHHWRAYGEWSPAIKDYEDESIMTWHESAEYKRLRELVDPYSYLNQFDLPKFIINAASDEFFLPDSWKFYWDDLPGEKYLRYVPNTGHNIRDTDVPENIISFYHHLVTGQELPAFRWNTDNYTITVETDPFNPPDELKLWQAVNPEGRDFRLYVIEKTWESTRISLSESGIYEFTISEPEKGYRIGFVEATFNQKSFPLKLSTGTVVAPDMYPHPPFTPEISKGTLSE